jgi:regulator of protease activity HflC (stomatin/prohibitin superfamily)
MFVLFAATVCALYALAILLFKVYIVQENHVMVVEDYMGRFTRLCGPGFTVLGLLEFPRSVKGEWTSELEDWRKDADRHAGRRRTLRFENSVPVGGASGDLRYDPPLLRAFAAGGAPVSVNLVLSCRVSDAKAAAFAKNPFGDVEDSVRVSLSEAAAKRSLEQIVREPAALAEEVLAGARALCSKSGIHIDWVRVQDVETDQEFKRRALERLAAEADSRAELERQGAKAELALREAQSEASVRAASAEAERLACGAVLEFMRSECKNDREWELARALLLASEQRSALVAAARAANGTPLHVALGHEAWLSGEQQLHRSSRAAAARASQAQPS